MVEQEKTNRLLKKVISKCPNLEKYRYQMFYWIEVWRIRIRNMFSGLLDPDSDPLVKGADPATAQDPSIIKQK